MNFHLKSVCAEWIFYVPMLECSVTVVTMLLINKIQYCKIQSVCCFARLHHANNIKVCYSYPITRSFCSTTIWNLERSRCSSTYHHCCVIGMLHWKIPLQLAAPRSQLLFPAEACTVLAVAPSLYSCHPHCTATVTTRWTVLRHFLFLLSVRVCQSSTSPKCHVKITCVLTEWTFTKRSDNVLIMD